MGEKEDLSTMEVKDWRDLAMNCAAAFGRPGGTLYLEMPRLIFDLRAQLAEAKAEIDRLKHKLRSRVSVTEKDPYWFNS